MQLKNKYCIVALIIQMEILLILMQSCDNKASKKTDVIIHPSKDSIAAPPRPTKTYTEITYHYDSIADQASFMNFDSSHSSAEKDIIAALNRLDKNRIGVGKKIIVPDTFYASLLDYSSLPLEFIEFDSIKKVIIISLRTQAFGAYENGQLIRWGPVSTGRKSKPTPPKLYYCNYKAKLKISTVDEEWEMPWYFNIDNFNGIGMHQFTLPGYPASHSCIRMFEQDAFWIFSWAEQWQLSGDSLISNGTPVIIYGNYDFNALSPWKVLPNDHHADRITAEEMQEIKISIQKTQ